MNHSWKNFCLYMVIFFCLFGITKLSFADLILWNKLGSEYEVTHSEVGPDGKIVGNIIFDSVKFGNGIRSYSDDNGYISLPDLRLGNKGTIECWVKPLVASDEITGKDVIFGIYYDDSNRINLAIDYDSKAIYFGGHYDGHTMWSSTPVGISWNANDIFHIAAVWDEDGFDGNKKSALYINNELIGYDTTPFSFSTIFDKTETQYGILVHFYSPFTRYYSDNVLVDNIKIWNYAKTDFSDRFNEGPIRIGLDINPNTLNLKSEGRFITAYLCLNEEITPDDVQIDTLRITSINFEGGTQIESDISVAEDSPTEMEDFDGDGYLDLMVKFDRATVIEKISEETGQAEFSIGGETFSGQTLLGKDTIRIKK